jgi:hypothetical protein
LSWRDEHRHLKPQWRFLRDRKGEMLVDYVGRFESLQDDLEKIEQHLGCSLRLPRPPAATIADYRSHYDCEMKRTINRVYQDDLEHFGYEF